MSEGNKITGLSLSKLIINIIFMFFSSITENPCERNHLLPTLQRRIGFFGDVANNPASVSTLHILKRKNRREEEICRRMQTTRYKVITHANLNCVSLVMNSFHIAGGVANHPTNNVSIHHILNIRNPRREEELCKRMQKTRYKAPDINTNYFMN